MLRLSTALLALLLGSCSASPPPSAPGRAEDKAAELLQAEVEQIRSEQRPTFQLVRRDGDPSPAIAVSLAASSEHVLIALALLEPSLNQAGFGRLGIFPSAQGLTLSTDVADFEEAKRFVLAVRSALSQQLESSAKELETASQLLTRLVKPPKEGASLCQNELSLSQPSESAAIAPLKLADAEEALRALRSPQSVAFGLLGPGEFLQAATELSELDWPSGSEPSEEVWPSSEDVYFDKRSPNAGVSFELLSSESSALLQAVEALNQAEHPLHKRLAGLATSFTLEKAQVSLQRAGACAQITLQSTVAEPQDATLAQALQIAESELQRELKRTGEVEASARAQLTPADAADAAAVASWVALQSDTPGKEVRRAFVFGPKLSERMTTLEAFLKEQKERAAASAIPFAAQNERGQAEAYLLLASPCGARGDENEEAGLRALTLRSVAAQFSGSEGVTLEAWTDQDGLGLLAHAARRRGESEEELGARLSRAIAAAVSGPQIDGRVVAHQRHLLLEEIGADPGQEMMTTLLSSGHLGMLTPHGLERTLARLSASDVERTRGLFLSEPLRALYTSNFGEQQSSAAQLALDEWLAPTRGALTRCPMPSPEPTASGLWEIETVSENTEPSAQVGAFAPAPRELGFALSYLLNRPDGYLERALGHDAFEVNAEARFWGGSSFGGLSISLHGPDEKLDPAVAQVRALLQQLALNGIPEAEAKLAQAEAQRRRSLLARTPRGRLIQRYFALPELSQQAGAPPPPAPVQVAIDAASLSGISRELSASRQLVVRVKRRK